MSFQAQQKKPISPQQLFKKLLAGNYKQIECIDEATQIRQQRQILVSLISQYRQQIGKRMQEYDKLQKLVNVRNALRLQLERYRNDRIKIDQDIEYQIQRNRLKPTQISDHSQRKVEIEELRFKNAGLQGRLRQLAEYALKIQRHNALLEKENIIVHQSNIRTRAFSEVSYAPSGCADDHCGALRERIKAMRFQQDNMTRNMMDRIRVKQQQNIVKVKLQQQEIAERNRRRMASFQQRFRRI